MINARWENKEFIYYYRKSRALRTSKKCLLIEIAGLFSLLLELFNPTYGKVLLSIKSQTRSFLGSFSMFNKVSNCFVLEVEQRKWNANQCHSILNNFLHVSLSLFFFGNLHRRNCGKIKIGTFLSSTNFHLFFFLFLSSIHLFDKNHAWFIWTERHSISTTRKSIARGLHNRSLSLSGLADIITRIDCWKFHHR